MRSSEGGAATAGSRGLLRTARLSDAARISEIYAPIVRDSAISFELEPPDAQEMEARLQATLEDLPWLVCERDSTVAGYGYASRFHPRAAYSWAVELSVYVVAATRGQGVGRAILSALVDVLARQGFTSGVALIALPNPASVRLFESLGFERVGFHPRIGFKLGRWHDVGRWQRALAQRRSHPARPAPFASLGPYEQTVTFSPPQHG